MDQVGHGRHVLDGALPADLYGDDLHAAYRDLRLTAGVALAIGGGLLAVGGQREGGRGLHLELLRPDAAALHEVGDEGIDIFLLRAGQKFLAESGDILLDGLQRLLVAVDGGDGLLDLLLPGLFGAELVFYLQPAVHCRQHQQVQAPGQDRHTE